MLLTQGIVSLPAGVVEVITAKVRGFTDFSEENDPRGEHDFGSFKQDGANIYWNGSHNDQACARIGSHMGCQADERTENLSEFPRKRAEIQGRFAEVALAPQPNRRCCLTVVETHFL